MTIKMSAARCIQLVVMSLLCTFSSRAQLTSGDVFLQGSYVEVGIAPNASYGSRYTAPSGYHPRGGAGSTRLGFIADPAKDGWSTGTPNYFGDYFIPGDPYEGWDIQVNGSKYSAHNDDGPTAFTGTLSGANVSYTSSGALRTGVWEGSVDSVFIRQTTILRSDKLYFVIRIMLKNMSSVTKTGLYYHRGVNADNEQPITSDYATRDTIEYRIPNNDNKVLVSADGNVYNSYLGLGTKDCRAKPYLARGSTPLPTAMLNTLYTGVSGYIYDTGVARVYNNYSMGIVYNLGSLAAGDSTTFSYTYILRRQDLDSALMETQPSWLVGTTTYNSGDTIRACLGSTVNITLINGDTYTWGTWSPGTGLASASGKANAILVGDTVITYRVIGTTASCGPADTMYVTIAPNALPAAPSVSSPLSLCTGATASALTASGSSLKWYTAASGGTGSTTAPTPSTASAGSVTYYVSQTSAAGCESSRTPLTVNVYTTPAAPIVVTPFNLCQSGDTGPLMATGVSMLWYTTATGGTGSSTTPVPSTTSAGTTYYYVSQTSSDGCESARASVEVNINPLPARPGVSSPVNLCVGGAAVPLTATGTSLMWYTTATGGSGSASAPTPSTAAAGTVTYYVSQSAAGCEGPRDSIVVQVHSLPAAPSVSSPLSLCTGTTASALTATGTSLKWYTTATGGTGSTTAPVPSTAATGSTTYYVSQTSAMGCEGPRSALTVNVYATPAAPVVSTPVVLCQNGPSSALTATGTSLLWYSAATGGSGSTTAPVPATTAVGTTSYYVSQTTGDGCEGPRALIVADVKANPAAPSVTTPIHYCTGTGASALSATGTSLLWYTVASGGSGSSTAPVPLTTAAGTTTYYVSQTSSDGCEGARSAIVVNVTSTPTAPVVATPLSLCTGTTTAALSATGTSLLWYTSATGGTGSSTAPTPSTATAGTVTYYVSQTSADGCEGPRAALTVNTYTTPDAPAVSSPVIYCVGTTASALTATGTSLLWYTLASGGTGSSTAPTPATTAAGSANYYVSQTTSDGCEGPRANIVVDVYPNPAAPTVTSPVQYCSGTTASALTATGASGTTFRWYTGPSGGTASTTAPVPSTATSGSTTYYVSQVTGVGCEGPRAAITVNVVTTPGAPAVSTPVNYCKDATATALSATGTSLLWYTTATGGTGSNTAPTPSTTSAGTVAYYVSQSSAAGCEGPRATILVVTHDYPDAPGVTSPVKLCLGGAGTTLTAAGLNIRWYTAATGGTGTATAPSPGADTLGTKTWYVSQTSAYGCESARATVRVVVNSLPVISIVPSGSPAFAYCPGESVTLKAVSSSAVSGYSWMRNGSTITGATDSLLAASSNADYSVVITDTNTCTASASVYVFGDTTLPDPLLSPIDLQFCEGVNIMLYCSPSAGGYTYEWIKDGTTVSGASGPSHVINVAGKYAVNVTDIFGCTVTSNVTDLTTYPAMAKPVITRADPMLRVSNTYNTYQWYRNNKAIAGANTFTYTMLFDGKYYVEVSDTYGCIKNSDTVTVIALGIGGQTTAGELHLYPNPSAGKVYIEAPFAVDIMVKDITGQILLQRGNATEADLGDYADGIYLFTITSREGILLYTGKINKISGR